MGIYQPLFASENQKDQVVSAGDKAREYLVRQHRGDHWLGMYRFGETNENLYTTMYLLLMNYLRYDSKEKDKAIEYLVSSQNSTGGWGNLSADLGLYLAFNQLKSQNYSSVDLSTSIQQLTNLLSGYNITELLADADPLIQMFYILNKDIDLGIPPVDWNIMQAVMNAVSKELDFANLGLDTMEDPSFLSRISAWAQGPMLSFLIIFLLNNPMSNKTTFQFAYNLGKILELTQLEDGSWFNGLLITLYASLALYELGNSIDSPVLKKAIDFFKYLQLESGALVRFKMPIWDTAWSLLAYEYSKPFSLSPDDIVKKTAQYLVDSKISPENFTDNLLVPYVEMIGFKPGGWGYAPAMKLFPDFDTTAMVAAALQAITPNFAREATEYLLDSQNDDGGWGTYIQNLGPQRNITVIRQEFLNNKSHYYEKMTMDPSTPDITGHVLFSLGRNGYGAEHPAVQKAIQYLRDVQNADGSWTAMWGWLYIYATTHVLFGLAEVGADLDAAFVTKSVNWLLSIQKPDGGWGEERGELKDKGVPVSTAWAIIGLLSAGIDPDSQPIRRGIEFLLKTQESNGTWIDNYSMFNAIDSTKYSEENNAISYPLLALALYMQKKGWFNVMSGLGIFEFSLFALVLGVLVISVVIWKRKKSSGES